jgi:molybdopterin-binding protein
MNYNYQDQQNYYGEDQYSCPMMRSPYYYVNQVPMMPSQANSQMKLSARNIFKGTVVKVKVGDIVGSVLVDIGCGNSVSSIITADSIQELELKLVHKLKLLLNHQRL